MGNKFNMKVEIGSYDMDGVMLDMGSNINILLNKYLDYMGKQNLVWFPIQFRSAKQYKIYPFGRLEKVEVKINEVNTKE